MRPDIRPEFHFLLIAPNLGAEWLFDAARQYWDAFRPIITPDFDFLRIIPFGRTISVTVIAGRDMISALGVELAQIAPQAYLDAVIYETVLDARRELNRRAQEMQPFGVPISTATPTVDPNAVNLPIIPTPRLPETREPAGFITQTPAPGAVSPAPPLVTPSSTPNPARTPGPDEPQPIQRTPGPITGGS